jgi:hypothetical protein
MNNVEPDRNDYKSNAKIPPLVREIGWTDSHQKLQPLVAVFGWTYNSPNPGRRFFFFETGLLPKNSAANPT